MKRCNLIVTMLCLLLGTGLAKAATKQVSLTFASDATNGITWNANDCSVDGFKLTFTGGSSKKPSWTFSGSINLTGMAFTIVERTAEMTFELVDESNNTAYYHWFSTDAGTKDDLANLPANDKGSCDLTKIKQINLDPRTGDTDKYITFSAITLTIEEAAVGDTDDSLFPLTAGGVKTDIWQPEGTTNSYDATTKTITIGADGNAIGWDFGGAKNLSAYSKLVIELQEALDFNPQLRFRNATAKGTEDKDVHYISLPSGQAKIEIDLTAAQFEYDGIGDGDKVALDLTDINAIYFWAWAGERQIKLKSVYLEKDGSDSTSTPTSGSYAITIDSGIANGTVTANAETANAETANAGTTITFTATPATGYRLDNLTVQVTTDAGSASIRPQTRTDGVDVGTATEVTMTYDATNGNYTGTYSMPANDIMVKASFVSKTDIATGGAISGFDAQYKSNGSAITPSPTLTVGGATVDASNYTVTYSNNTDPGTATITLTANALSELYKGTISATFQIVENFDVTLTLTDGLATFFSSDHAYKLPAGATAYTGTIGEGVVNLTEISGNTIQKGQAVIVKSEAGSVLLEEDETSTETFTGSNDLKGSDTALAVEGSDNIYVLKNGAFIWAVSGTLPAHKAYIVYPKSALTRRLVISFDGDDTTGIESVSQQPMTNGDTVYDLQGRKVKGQPSKGVYIVNGKKVILK